MNRAQRRAEGLMGARVVYGARCSWWGSIHDVGHSSSGLPCCPHCGSVLFEIPDESTWWIGVDKAEAEGRPGYRAFITWLRDRCYPSLDEARIAYDDEQTTRPTEAWPDHG